MRKGTSSPIASLQYDREATLVPPHMGIMCTCSHCQVPGFLRIVVRQDTRNPVRVPNGPVRRHTPRCTRREHAWRGDILRSYITQEDSEKRSAAPSALI